MATQDEEGRVGLRAGCEVDGYFADFVRHAAVRQPPGAPAAVGDFASDVLASADPAGMQTKFATEIAIGPPAVMASVTCSFRMVRPAPRTGSPLRGSVTELRVLDPVGLWLPTGFGANGCGEYLVRRHPAASRRCV